MGQTDSLSITRRNPAPPPPCPFIQHEIFALFGDCSRWDGMVERLIVFEDDERSVVAEIRERFQRRKDKLRERRVYPLKVREGGKGRGLDPLDPLGYMCGELPGSY